MPRQRRPINRRRVLLTTGCLLVFLGGIALWRATHPHLTDPEQIAASLSDIMRQATKRNARGITQYFGPGFDWQGQDRQDLQRWLAGGFIQSRDVQLNLSSVNTQITGDEATTTGAFRVSLRQTPEASPEQHSGDFKLYWRRHEGQWKIFKAEGGEALPD